MLITSLLDTDLYKLTMMQIVHARFPDTTVEYRFYTRTIDFSLAPLLPSLQEAIADLAVLRFSEEELRYLSRLSCFSASFIDFLRDFSLNPDFIFFDTLETGECILRIVGPWVATILFEVPLLAIINELFYQKAATRQRYAVARENLELKIEKLKNEVPHLPGFSFTDFGTRRRFSKSWQQEVLVRFQETMPGVLQGTSNVYFAKQLGLQPVGTMAHEYVQAFQVLAPNCRDSQIFAFEQWLAFYGGALNIALSDTLGIEAFFQDFNLLFAQKFAGIRQDSGDPVLWAERLIRHYQEFGINASEKIIVFSDCLTFEKALFLFKKFNHRIISRFGIGTHLMNDCGLPAVQNVIKLVRCNGKPVAKISDTLDKTVCMDLDYLKMLQNLLPRKINH